MAEGASESCQGFLFKVGHSLAAMHAHTALIPSASHSSARAPVRTHTRGAAGQPVFGRGIHSRARNFLFCARVRGGLRTA